MLIKLLISFCLMALCVAIHAIGIMLLLRRIDRSVGFTAPGFLTPTWSLIRIAVWIILLHLVEICLWGVLYICGQALPDPQSAFYFSSVTYTTVGYGDLVLPEGWRLIGGDRGAYGYPHVRLVDGIFFHCCEPYASAQD